MDGQRQRSGWGRGRRRKARNAEPRGAVPEPIRIAARRPDSPLIAKAPPRTIAASAVPHRPAKERDDADVKVELAGAPVKAEPQRRAARIVPLGAGAGDDRERERKKLLGRLMACQGRGAITRAADEYLAQGFALPQEQEVHLQLLEHFDEGRARDSLAVMGTLLEEEDPIKKPVLDQRLRRLEEHADEHSTRDLAAALRRALRT